ALRHTRVNGVFGDDGTNGTSWNGRASAWNKGTSQFYGLEPQQMRIISVPALRAFTWANPPAGYEVPGGGVGNTAAMDIDNSGGHRDGYYYIATTSNGYALRGFSDGGSPLPNFPIPFPGRICGVSVDNEGFVWVANVASEAVEKYNPANGNLVETVGVSATGVPCEIELDENNSDLYVQTENGPIWKYTKASGYSTHVQLTEPTGSGTKFTVNA